MSRKLKAKADALLAAERGTISKARGTEVAVALAYPNTYHIGMSNLGVHQIYSILNRRADTACERVFLPDEDDVEEYSKNRHKIVLPREQAAGEEVRHPGLLRFL